MIVLKFLSGHAVVKLQFLNGWTASMAREPVGGGYSCGVYPTRLEATDVIDEEGATLDDDQIAVWLAHVQARPQESTTGEGREDAVATSEFAKTFRRDA